MSVAYAKGSPIGIEPIRPSVSLTLKSLITLVKVGDTGDDVPSRLTSLRLTRVTGSLFLLPLSTQPICLPPFWEGLRPTHRGVGDAMYVLQRRA